MTCYSKSVQRIVCLGWELASAPLHIQVLFVYNCCATNRTKIRIRAIWLKWTGLHPNFKLLVIFVCKLINGDQTPLVIIVGVTPSLACLAQILYSFQEKPHLLYSWPKKGPIFVLMTWKKARIMDLCGPKMVRIFNFDQSEFLKCWLVALQLIRP